MLLPALYMFSLYSLVNSETMCFSSKVYNSDFIGISL